MGLALTSKKAFAIWILVVLTFLAMLGTLHAWISWQIQGVDVVTIFSLPMEISTYFIATMTTAFFFIGATCYVLFHGESLNLPLYRLGKDFEAKLEAKSEEIKNSTDEALTKLGLKEFQLKESVKTLQKKLGELEMGLKENMESSSKILGAAQKKLLEIERGVSKIETAQKILPNLEKKLQTIEIIENDLKNVQDTITRFNFVPGPYLASTDNLDVLEGTILRPTTVRQLRQSGIEKIEDLLLKNPMEIALAKAMSEGEAKNLQSVIQLLMVPGIQHEDAVLLLKSGVNSKQELALQDTLGLGARVAKTAELYVAEGKIKESEKPTLEEIASWIRLAKTQ